MTADEQGDEQQVAWTAIEKGTSVIAEDGTDIGKVSAVVADVNKDIFSGIAFRHGLFDSQHFIPADLIDVITSEQVRVRVTQEEAKTLEPYDA